MPPPTEVNSELGLAGEAVQACIQALALIGSDAKLNSTDIRDRVIKLRLWADGFNVQTGGLDNALDTSPELKEAVYVALYDIVKTIRMCNVSTQTRNDFRDCTSFFPSIFEKMGSVRGVLEYSSTAQEDSDESDTDSDSQDTLSDFIDDLLDLTPQLMSLQESFAKTQSSANLNKSSYSLPLVVPADKPEDYFQNNLRDKYVGANDAIIVKFGEASWHLFQSIRDGLTKRDELVKATSNQDRDSAYCSMMQSEAAPSLIGQLQRRNTIPEDIPDDISDASSVSSVALGLSSSGAPPIPKAPVELGSGVAFICPICCGRQTKIDSTRKWLKHIFRDTRPYLCTYNACLNSKMRYSRRTEWEKHESECRLKGSFAGPSKTSPPDVLETNSQLTDKKSSFSEYSGLEKCPFCPQSFHQFGKKRSRHIAGHMEEITVRILSFILGSDEQEDSSDGSGHDSDSVDEVRSIASDTARPLSSDDKGDKDSVRAYPTVEHFDPSDIYHGKRLPMGAGPDLNNFNLASGNHGLDGSSNPLAPIPSFREYIGRKFDLEGLSEENRTVRPGPDSDNFGLASGNRGLDGSSNPFAPIPSFREYIGRKFDLEGLSEENRAVRSGPDSDNFGLASDNRGLDGGSNPFAHMSPSQPPLEEYQHGMLGVANSFKHNRASPTLQPISEKLADELAARVSEDIYHRTIANRTLASENQIPHESCAIPLEQYSSPKMDANSESSIPPRQTLEQHIDDTLGHLVDSQNHQRYAFSTTCATHGDAVNFNCMYCMHYTGGFDGSLPKAPAVDLGYLPDTVHLSKSDPIAGAVSDPEDNGGHETGDKIQKFAWDTAPGKLGIGDRRGDGGGNGIDTHAPAAAHHHSRQHMDQHDRPYKCTVEGCEQASHPSRKALKNHIRTYHTHESESKRQKPTRHTAPGRLVRSSRSNATTTAVPEKVVGSSTDNTTAPPAPNKAVETDEIRCICGYTDDDGLTICCDECGTWQHIVCMGLSIDYQPSEYKCSRCLPREVDAKKARRMQRERREEDAE